MDITLAEKALYIVSKKFPIRYHYDQNKKAYSYNLLENCENTAATEQVRNLLDELHLRTPEEINQLYSQTKRQEAEKDGLYLQERRRLEEQNRFFNQPRANADFNHWGKMPYWTVEEAIALSFGKSPDIVSWKEISVYKDSSPFVKKYMKAQKLVQRALEAKELKYEPGSYGSNTKRIKPYDFVNWAKTNNLDFPTELEKIILERVDKITDWQALYKEKDLEVEQLKKKLEDSQNKRKEHATKARASTNSNRILKMALAVIAKDKYKYGKDSNAIGTMLSYFDKQGLNIDDQTLRSHIDEGLVLLNNRKTSV